MSLLVWLPLIDDLRNNGLAKTSAISTANLSFVANGKIGKCMSGYTGFFSVPSMANKKQLSVAYWVRINTATATNWLDAFTWYSTDGTTSQESRNEFYTNSTHTGFWFAGSPSKISGKTNTVGAWQHHAFTIDYSAGTAEFFINGVSVGKTTGVYTTHYLTGNNFRIGENGLDASYNDFRLYDHCLSTREVKELSKGLVAHWKLDDLIGNENLLPKSDKAGNATTAWTWDGASAEAIDGYLKVYFTGSGNNRIYDYVADNTWVSGKTYTISLWAKTTTDDFALRLSRSLIDYAPNISLTSEWKYYSVQIQSTATSASGTISIQSNKTGVAWIKFVKLEEGSVATQWIPAKTDDMYSYWELDKAHDSSGYDHDGILSPNPPKFELDTARHSSCLNFASASTNYIDCGIDTWLPTDQVSVAWWGYMESWSSYDRAISCMESGGWNFERNSGKMMFRTYKNGIGHTKSHSTTSLSNLSSGWHHFVGTFDGYVNRIYIDGEFEGVSTDSSPDVKTAIKYNVESKLFIGCEASGTTPYTPYFNGKLSDIRIYATALSADDIKELYNTSASIDDHHNVYARELVED